MPNSENRAVFLDRDGVLNPPVFYPEWGFDSPSDPGHLRLYDDVAGTIKLLRQHGFLAVLISNQPGMAKGKYSRSTFQEIDRRLTMLLSQEGTHLDGRYYCLHHPEATVSSFRTICDCRKPMPGLLLKAANEMRIDLSQSFFIGDSNRDVEAGNAAGCQPIRVDRDGISAGYDLVPTVRDLFEAANYIQGRRRVHVA